ncbi:MAG TPA: hypothetical protein VMX14_13285 [Anaerolineae bacterium]|nr:hypothetical protein [Anaerolineae bacterium]
MYQPPYYPPPPEPDRPSKRRANRLSIAAGLALILAAAVGAIVVTNRLSDQSLAVLAGALCGMGAAIPTSLLIIAITRRREEPKRETTQVHQSPYPYQPPVFMIAPQPYQQPAPPPPRPEPTIGGWTESQRSFTVIGQNTPDSRWPTADWGDDPQ